MKKACKCPWNGDPTDNGIHLPGCPGFVSRGVEHFVPLSHKERLRLIRAPISRGILSTIATGTVCGKSHAGNGERPELPVYNNGRIVGTRARRLSDGVGF